MTRLALSLIAAGLFGSLPVAATAHCVDLSLVLAVDSSSSIDEDEFRMQVLGYAAAFSDPAVLGALKQAGTVDVATVFWADSAQMPLVVPWQRIRSGQDAAAVAQSLLQVQRGPFGDTDIGDGLNTALDLLEAPDRCAVRAVVNVSGDGRASVASRASARHSVSAVKKRAEEMGVTINALAILNAEPSLAEYYREEVITGAGSFVMEATDFHAFGQAIIRKLEREIQPQLSAALDLGKMR